MEALLPFLVLMGVGWVIVSITSRVRRAANQQIFSRGAHQKGTEYRKSRSFLTTLEPDDLIARLVDAIGAPTQPTNALYPSTFLAHRDARVVTYRHASKIQSCFTVRLSAVAARTGSELTWTVPEWSESDGVMAGLDKIEELKNQVSQVAATYRPRDGSP